MNHKTKQHYDRVEMCWRFASANCSYADTDCWFRHCQTAQVTESAKVNCNLCDKECNCLTDLFRHRKQKTQSSSVKMQT